MAYFILETRAGKGNGILVEGGEGGRGDEREESGKSSNRIFKKMPLLEEEDTYPSRRKRSGILESSR